ncbi:hypothetical protein K9K85_02805 [Patescibacteria group bacterium]|nr:hypothetical protein [Patescibacteria group bacterium]
MSKVLQKLREVIISSSISATDQNDLLVFLPILPESVLEELFNIFSKDLKKVKEFNDNFKSRLDVLVGGGNKWDDLIAREEKIFNEEEDTDSKDLF